MARSLHIAGHGLPTGRLLFLIGFVLWNAAGCALPPPEFEEGDNLPPWIDWSKTEPASDDVMVEFLGSGWLTFRIGEAVFDPEGDPLDIIWYWEMADQESPVRLSGYLEMLLYPCDSALLKQSVEGYFTVNVVVSDGILTWNPGEYGDLHVDVEEGHDISKRLWVVRMGEHACNEQAGPQ